MAIYKQFSPNIRSACSVVMMIALWLTLAPTQVGGPASYIIVIGKSMEPKFHIGDLVIVHKQPIYQVGDAIVYHNQELKNFVFHRIISQQMGRYTLKGDNNSWVDDYKPSHEDVIGKLWLYIPGGGIAIQKIRSPFSMALIAGVLGAILATSLFADRAKGNKRMNNKSFRERVTSIRQKAQNWLATTRNPEPRKSLNFNQGELLEGSFVVWGVIALSSLILGIIAFSRPTSRITQDDINYEHLGIFSYSASSPQGVYDADTIKSGDPIFTKLSCSVDVNFQYTLVAGQAKNIVGTYQLTAIISEQVSGWQRVVPLQEKATFKGAAFGTTAKLDLCRIESLIQSMQEKTTSLAGSYTLVVTPNINLNGEVSGRVLESTFHPALTFHYDRIQFYLVRNEELSNPLALTETGILSEEQKEDNTILLLGREIAIPTLRVMSLFGLIGSVSGFILFGLHLRNLSLREPEKFFNIKYNSMIVDIQNGNSITTSSMIESTTIDALAKLAERFGTMILHTEQDHRHTYYVQAGGLTYRFMMDTNKTAATICENEVISQELGV